MSDDVRGQVESGHPMGGAEERLRSVVKDCVHCGFCLPACPTYSLWGEEMDSPRGRIHLVSQLLDGAPLTSAAHGVHDRLPVRGAVRPDHRGGTGVDRDGQR
jgi:ferredoxin